jgi:uncharacterized protein (TIGR02145 family)
MKLKNILYYLAVIVLFTSPLWAANTNPVVTNVTFSILGTTVTVHYDVTDAEQSTVTISMEVSSDGGSTWAYNFGIANGAIGTNIAVGTGKIITWTYSGGYNNQFQIKIIADDLVGDQIYYAGKIYNTVTIGSQIWLKENLDVGTKINGGVNQTNNSTIEKYCYNDNAPNCTTYGGLYQWNEAMQYDTTSGAKGICPTGWHIPTYAEFQTLATTVGNNGNALKAVGQGAGNGTGTNTSGFSALLAGYRYNSGFDYLVSYTWFWSSTEYNALFAYYMCLYNGDSGIYFSSSYNKTSGFSIRCVKD